MTAPLDGIIVLDLTRNLAGPFCTMILGDLGAQIIKIEKPGTGDDTRAWCPPSWEGTSSLFLAINRNKQSIELDIDSEEGAEVLRKLVGKADVVVESFRGGSLDTRGFDFESFSAINPHLVYCSLSAFGNRGPMKEQPGYDALRHAFSGILSLTGESDGPPVRVGPSIIDMGSAHWAALGILAALRRHDQTGEAQRVETSLLETGVSWMSYFIAGYFADGSIAGRNGTRHSAMAPYEDFRTKDGSIYLAAPNQSLFEKLCKIIGAPEIAQDPRFASNSDRLAHREKLHDAIEQRLVQEGSATWEDLFQKGGVPSSQLQTIDQLVVNPQVQALDLLRDYYHADIPNHRLVDHPVSYNGTRSFQHSRAPKLGEHTESVLRSLDFDDDAIARMRRSGTIGESKSS